MTEPAKIENKVRHFIISLTISLVYTHSTSLARKNRTTVARNVIGRESKKSLVSCENVCDWIVWYIIMMIFSSHLSYHAHSHTQILPNIWKTSPKNDLARNAIESQILFYSVFKSKLCALTFIITNNRMMVREVLFPFWSRAWRVILRCWSTCGTITNCWRAWRRTIVIVIWFWRMWRRCGQRPLQQRERRQSTRNVLSAKCFSEVTLLFSSFEIPLRNNNSPSVFSLPPLLYIPPNN